MNLLPQPAQTVEAAELLARLAKAEQIAREHLETTTDSLQRANIEGEIVGLKHAARCARELANWPVEADSDRA